MKIIHAPVAMALMAIFCANLFAQSASNDTESLPTVVVSATRNQTRVEDMPLHTTVISQEEIEKSTAQTLDQLLRNVPGMNFTGIPAALSDPTGHQTKMRGLGNAKVLVELYRVAFDPLKEISFISDEYNKFEMEGSLLADATKPFDAVLGQFGRIVQL